MVDPLVRVEVDAEGLLAQQVLARIQAIDIDLLVEVVGDGGIDGLHGVLCEQLAILPEESR